MENETAEVVVEETAGSVLNKGLIIGGVVLGGLAAFTLVPKVVRKLRSKRSKIEAPMSEDSETQEEG